MTVSIPAVTYTDHIWHVDPDGTAGRARRQRASGPYQSCVPTSLAQLTVSLPADVAADIDEASSELAHFDSYVRHLLARQALALPMASIMLRTESASSSQIEQITVSARQLALAELSQSMSRNATTVLSNVKAMEEALATDGDLDNEAILHIHKTLLASQPGWASQTGRYRNQLVWVGSSSLGPLGASHVAPQPELVPRAMDDLIRFMSRVDLPLIYQIAVSHAQFETIHPFADGNGRTGRALVHAQLRGSGLVTHGVAPVSAGILRNTQGYFDALTAYRSGDTLPIIQQFADASRFAAHSGRALISDLLEQLEEDQAKMSGLRSHAMAWKVLPWLVARPVMNTASLAEVAQISATAARRALDQLTHAGVLTERSGYKRNQVWHHNGLIQILDAYAEGLRRQ